jgi:hypothetical protein
VPGIRDLKDLSDEELFALADTSRPPAPSLESLSDAELEAMASPAASAPKSMSGAELLAHFDAAENQREGLQAKHGSLGEQVATGVEGGLRGLSLGLSDMVSAGAAGLAASTLREGPTLTPEARERAAQLGIDTNEGRGETSFGEAYDAARAEQMARAEANPTIAMGSELVGAVLPAILSGGESALARGAAYTPAGLVSRAGGAVSKTLAGAAPSLVRAGLASAAGGALEGGVAGAMLQGSRLTTEEMANPAEAAESVVAAASSGALLGGLVGGVFGGASHALKGGADKLDEAALAARPKAAPTVAEVLPDPESISISLEARPLSASALPDPPRGKWEAMAARSRAVQGGFDDAVSESTAAVRADADLMQREMSQIDEFAGIAAKRRANALNIGHPVGLQEIDGVLGEMNGQLDGFLSRNSRAALAPDGGLNAIERVRNVFEQERPFLQQAAESGDIGELYGRLDNLKRTVGRARGTKSASVQDLMEQVYKPMQNFLEDESVWGELAVRQRGANAAWSNRISSTKDARLRQFFSEAGGNENRAANEWDQLKLSNAGAIKSLLSNVGDNGVADVEEAFRRNVRATARDATERAKAWGTPELQARAVKVTNAAKRIEDKLDSVALLRRDAIAGQHQMQQSTAEMLAGAAGVIAPPVGWAITGTAQAGRKLIQAVGNAGSGMRASVTSAAAKLVRNVGAASQAIGDAAVLPAATMLPEKRFLAAVSEARQLTQAGSPATNELLHQAAELEREDPALAEAYAGTQIKRAEMINSMIPDKPLSGAVFSPPPALNEVTERKVRRAVQASLEPQKALDRIAAGNHSPEDLKAVKTVYPAMWSRFQQTVLSEFKAMQKKPDLQTRLRIAYATGLNLDPTVEIGAIEVLQRVAVQPDQQNAAEEKQGQGDQQQAQAFKGFDANEVYAGPVDARIDRR